ncbi:amino acid adenylation domain-containing protein [Streptomyces sp. NPDC017966]|uniref:amino acid adenylation domain-containing protein n=1 Tax=Streptomyces sp. NPDC017966 TaxID=3365023 RepID=UPI0037A2F43D
MTQGSDPAQHAIAIIGVAFTLPEAEHLSALHDNLGAGRVSVRPPATDRVRHAGGDPDAAYAPCAYLHRIDQFDHAYFGLSRREAEFMDPQQRIALQLSHRAIENAGYAPGALKGSRTAVMLSAPHSRYASLFTEPDPQQILGTIPSATPARVAYLLGLHGPVLTVDTACSSGLAAVAMAVRELRRGETDLALAGGVSLHTVLHPRESVDELPGIMSPTGLCRPFDTAADGSVGGEGGGVVLLKPLARALTDGDHIHAVLRGVAVSHNGYRATSMSAPSQDGQADTITAAWQDAGVPLTSAGYFEGHGSGTPLGDMVEIAGLQRVLDGANAREPYWIGGVKGNVGHLDHASGVAGLLKVLAGLRHHTLYPTAHFTTPHTAMRDGGAVRVNDVPRPWRSRGAGQPRRAGVSSFGLTGTNVHVMVEEAPRPARPAPAATPAELVTVSAASPAALARYTRRLSAFAATTEHHLAEVAHALNRGRDDHRHRLAVVARSTGELSETLAAAVPPEEPVPPTAPPVVLLFSGDSSVAGVDDAAWLRLCAELDVADGAPAAGETAAARLLRRQHVLRRILEALGLDTGRLVGSGPGNLAVHVARGRMSLAEALESAADGDLTDAVDDEGLGRAVRDFVRSGALLVEVGGDGVLSRRMRGLGPGLPIVPLPADQGRRGVLEALAQLYGLGAAIDWNRAYAHTDLARVEVPTYPFEETPCWYGPQPTRRGAAGPPPETRPAPADDDTERTVAELWSRVLNEPAVGPDSDYFALGGNSIGGITVIRRIEAHFRVRVTFADLYRYRTVRQLAAVIEERRAGGGERADWEIPPLAAASRVPLSYNQEQLWFLDRVSSPGPLYNIPGVLRYRGPLDVPALRAALADVVTHQQVLRTRIPDEDGRPHVVFDAPVPPLHQVDLREVSEDLREAEVARLRAEEALAPFDLATGPLMRATLITVADDEHVLLLTWHHIVWDGASWDIFFDELEESYAARREGRAPQLPRLPLGFGDFAAWQHDWLRDERLRAGLRFWRAELAGVRPAELPLDRPRPAVESHAGALIEFTLPAEHAARVRRFSQEEGVSTFVTMLAAVNALLHHWAGWQDVVVGAATSGRFNPATHPLIGYFNNVLPFRTPVDPTCGFRELVRRSARTVTGVLDHEEIPFGKIVADLKPQRDPSRHPLYTVMYTHQNAASRPRALPGLTLVSEKDLAGVAPGTAKADLTLGVYDNVDGPMSGYLEYAVDLFDSRTMHALLSRFVTLVGAVLSEPDRRLADLAHDTAQTPPSILTTPAARPAGPPVTRALRAFAARRPHQPAVVDGDRVCDYAELDRLTDRLAARLTAAGVGPQEPVAVLAPRGVELVTGWLGVLRSGAAFVPLDPAAPAGRIEEILDELGCRVLVTTASLTPSRTEGRTVLTLCPDDGSSAAPVPDPGPHPQSLAYVCFTSGSTGRPHGCAISHGSLDSLLDWFGDWARLEPGDRVAQCFAAGFDGAVMEILGTLRHGATLHIVHDTLQTPAALLRRFADDRITVACLPTALAELVLQHDEHPGNLALRALAAGGDRLRVRPGRPARWRLANMYGPTECTVVSTCGEVVPSTGPALPDIGGPIPGTHAYVLDPGLRPCPVGRTGELYLGGAGVARGYHGLPAATAARFVADPHAGEAGARMYRTGDLVRLTADGVLEFHGRNDRQVEIRGRRVEPAEVERVLLEHPAVTEAAVLAEPTATGNRLSAHIAGEDAPAPADLRAWLEQRLPGHLVPDLLTTHDRLPQTPNGKYDRAALLPPAAGAATLHDDGNTIVTDPSTRPAPAVDRETAQRVLAGIWEGLLGHRPVRPEDNFFDIGGDSVLSIAVAARAERAGLALTPHDVLQHPVLGDLAEHVLPTHAAAGPAGSGPPRGPVPLIPIMHALLERAPDQARDFVVAETLRIDPGVPAETVRAALDRLVALHEPLRYRLRGNALGHRLECADGEHADLLDTRAVPHLDDDGLTAFVAGDAPDVVAGVDPVRGPMLRGRYYHRGPDRPGVLLLAVHHFAFDQISVVSLLEDLNAALRDPRPGALPDVPAASRRAWRAWAEHLSRIARSDELSGEVVYWRDVLDAGRARVALSSRPASPCTGTAVLRRRVPVDRVARVLSASGAPGREAALAAVGCAVSRWRGAPDAYVLTVSEGSPHAYRPENRANSLGWFTSAFPLVLPAATGQRADEALPRVAEVLRAVPNDGVGYGVLRHLSPDSPATRALRALPEPEILVEHNATGHHTLNASSGPAHIGEPLALPQNALLSYLPLAIVTQVTDGELHIIVAHDARLDDRRLDELADLLVEAFAELAGED